MSDDATDATFLRFPIGLLAYDPSNLHETLTVILDWGINHIAQAKFGEWDHDALKEVARDRDLARICGGRAPKRASDIRTALGASALNMMWHHLQGVTASQDRARRAEGFLNPLSPAAKNNLVHIRMDFFWNCFVPLSGKEVERPISGREFCILSAILSKVGAKGYKECSWAEIEARAAGCCGKRDLLRLSPAEKARREPLMLTRQQIRTTIESLEVRNFFGRFVYGRRGVESWYSFSHKEKAKLRALVLERKFAWKTKVAALRLGDAEASQSKPREQPTDNQLPANANSGKASNGSRSTNINSGVESGGNATNSQPSLEPTEEPTDEPTGQPTLMKRCNENGLNGNAPNQETTVMTAPPISFSFSEGERGRWGEFLKARGIEHPFPLEGCATQHERFRSWLDGSGGVQ